MRALDPVDHLVALGNPVLDPEQLVDEGYLQEANRRFFHPLGLHMALEVSRDVDDPLLIRVLDCRDAVAGVLYAPAEDESEAHHRSRRAAAVERQWTRRAAVRRLKTGVVRQPVEAPLAG